MRYGVWGAANTFLRAPNSPGLTNGTLCRRRATRFRRHAYQVADACTRIEIALRKRAPHGLPPAVPPARHNIGVVERRSNVA